jgi:hypothetical protein
MGAVIRSTVLFLAGIAAAMLVAEAGLRLFAASPAWRVLPVAEVALYGPDAETGYRHRAGVSGIWLQENRARVTTSGHGLRDRERSYERGGALRAVVLGNSLIEALQVEQPETATAVAERIVAGKKPGSEVVNLGLAGARPAVLAARLKSEGARWKPDVAIVVVDAAALLALDADDREFPAYAIGADGMARLSRGYLQTRGYAFRTSRAGTVLYWLLDHSRVVAVLNSRKNVGLLREWPQAPPPRGASDAHITSTSCGVEQVAALDRLWRGHQPADVDARLGAFIGDLGSAGMKVVLAMRDVDGGCAVPPPGREALLAAMSQRLAGSGVVLFDLEARMRALAGSAGLARLYGFGVHEGGGHLNVAGNRVMGEALAEIVEASLPR